jgi:mycofactocin system glycosyltransferase
MPVGIHVVPDLDTTRLDAASLVGGTPRRVMRLSAAGQAAWAELRAGSVRSGAAGVLARRLTDAGLAHPQPTATHDALDVTVIVPVRDRPTMLDRCLAAVGDRYPVVVVDDGSIDTAAVSRVASRRRATLVVRSINGGPAAARNAGLSAVTTELVAFLDSDCVAPADWIERLAPHFADPLVAVVAPRVVPAAPRDGGYLAACGNLDLGDRAARVQPGGRVSYVPTAALLMRRSALTAVACRGDVFDPCLRYGEDVDLIWRLDAAGWRVRYDPSVQVRHQEPRRWTDRLGRRFRYGTSAAPLARRHPDALAPLVIHPWPTLAVAGLLTRRPLMASVGLAASTVAMRGALRRADIANLGAVRLTSVSITRTWLDLGRYVTQFAAPILVAALVAPATSSGRWTRRFAAASLMTASPISTWLTRRPPINPVTFVAGQIADDAAYGAGVYAGCVRHATLTPLRPTVIRPTWPRRGAR